MHCYLPSEWDCCYLIRFNTESALRQSVEKDANALRKAKEMNEALNESLRADLDSLQNELLTLKADHEQVLLISNFLIQYITSLNH